MIHFDLHRLFDEATIEMFEHEHLWIHVVAHIVIVVMPIILLVIFTRWLYLMLARLSGHLSIRTPFINGNNAYSLPSGLFGFIIRYSGNAQLVLACLAIITLPVTYLLLELPKRIINSAISAETVDISNWEAVTQLEKVDYLLILVLESHLSLGALVASLASYKDLAPAIRELFNYYQRNQDAKLRYDEIRNYLLETRSGNLRPGDKLKPVSNQSERAA